AEWKEDADRVQQNGDEAKCNARVLERAPPTTSTLALLEPVRERPKGHVLLTQGRGNPVRLRQGHARLPGEHLEEIHVVPALDRRRGGTVLVVEAVDRDRPALSIDQHLDRPDRRVENLLHPLGIGITAPGLKPSGRARPPGKGGLALDA